MGKVGAKPPETQGGEAQGRRANAGTQTVA
jgi:hypothetical protein